MHMIQVTGIISLIIMAVVLIAGAVVTAMRRRDHGRAALFGMAGCIVLLLGVVLNIAAGLFMSMLGVLTVSAISNLISTIFQAVGIGLLVWGVIARRNPPQAGQPQGAGWPQPQQRWPQGGQQPPTQRPPAPQDAAQWPPSQQPPASQPPVQPGWQAPQQPPYGENQG
ncbi:hypothetical protein ABGB18_29395 [Nonomuraea sp. B12E4]|uniref:hypothetical protein n=1 Tax=Nonomuraea sp. B12E4 TaxID=3153564 RepID=UPI00325D0605